MRSPSGRSGRCGAESGADTCDSREIRRTTPWESPRTSGCLRLRAAFSFGSGQSSRLSSHRRGDTSPTWRCGSLRLCTQGVPETTFRTLFVFFNFARNSISQVLRCALGENETPSLLRVLPFRLPFATETWSIQNCAEARPGQAEPGDAKDIGRYQWDGGITRHAIGE